MQEKSPQRCGLVQIYTGKGKGKTTAAWGQSLRAVGRGYKVAVVQFMKPGRSGEQIAAEKLAPEIEVFGRTTPYDATRDQRESMVLRTESRQNFEMAKQLVKSGRHDLVVLDEFNIVLHYGFVSMDETLTLLMERPSHVEIIITGRYAPDWLIRKADLVTEMKEVVHPSTKGLAARKGIEY